MNRNNFPSFDQRCYQLIKAVPPGKVTTYKAVAQALGTQAFRAVGQAMHRNPNAPKTPCHRVINSNGDVGGYVYGTKRKIALLSSEGILIDGTKVRELPRYLARLPHPPRNPV